MLKCKMITKSKFETKYLKKKVCKTWNSCIKAKQKTKTNKQQQPLLQHFQRNLFNYYVPTITADIFANICGETPCKHYLVRHKHPNIEIANMATCPQSFKPLSVAWFCLLYNNTCEELVFKFLISILRGICWSHRYIRIMGELITRLFFLQCTFGSRGKR